MCNIAGITNIKRMDKEGSDLVEEVTKLMLKSMSRSNPHGAGVILSYRETEGFFTLKTPNTGAALSQVLELDKSKPFKHILLHTRYKTQGETSEVNSHPHLSPSGGLIHNGWCPELFDSIENGWHHAATELQEKLLAFNEKPGFTSTCDSEALALIFNENPAEMAKNLVGSEVFALCNLDNSGNVVTLYTQYNTVHMAYSHALEAVIFCTSKDVVQEALNYLGEMWPIAEVDHDMAYYFDGQDVTGGSFDFTEKAMENMEKHYDRYYSKAKNTRSGIVEYNGDGEIVEDRDDLDVYFRPRSEEVEWKKTILVDGSVVWEHSSGEVIHSDAKTVEDLQKMYANMPEESECEVVRDEPKGDYLDRDFEKIQHAIQKHIEDSVKGKY